jgi:ATP-dependent RNA helicase RhlB
LSLEQALAGKNIAGKAQTGSGKTAAFLVAILTRYLRTPENRAKEGGNPRALVIAPTRELVIQICKDADAIGKYCNLRSLAVYGGMDYDRQRKEVLGAPVDLLVATPGRLLDFVKSRVINLSNVDTLVIDEADRMLDMGFIPDVRRIMSYLPPKDKRATMLYSATLNDVVMRLAMNWMQEPYRAEVESETNATDTVKQVVYVIQAKDKFTVLFNHIALHPEARTIVFCNRKSTTEDVYESLKVRGVSVEMLSGDVNQAKRLKVLDRFRDNEVKVVVATDVAGRGIDIKGLEYVINFDFPYEAEDYVHRIGRTGRAGSTGVAISFADEFESCQIPDIEEYIKETLKCTVIGPGDPLLKELPARGTRLGKVDAAAKAEVDAREAVTEEEIKAKIAVIDAEFDMPEPKSDPVTSKLTDADKYQAAKSAVALDKFVEKYNLTGLAYYYEGKELYDADAITISVSADGRVWNTPDEITYTKGVINVVLPAGDYYLQIKRKNKNFYIHQIEYTTENCACFLYVKLE